MKPVLDEKQSCMQDTFLYVPLHMKKIQVFYVCWVCVWWCIGSRGRVCWLVFGRGLVVGMGAAGHDPCKKLQESSPGSKSASSLAEAEPTCVSAMNTFKRGKLVKHLLFWEFSFGRE